MEAAPPAPSRLPPASCRQPPTALLLLTSSPSRERSVARFYARPKAERKATYSRWWGAVKKEAKHYWVGG